MINIINGLMNSGKTLFMTYKGFLAFAKGKTVISNYDLNFPYIKINKDFLIYISQKEDTVIENACYLLDELWIWLDARSNIENTVATYFFLQSSKSDSEIYITSQTNRQNDIRLRENCHKITQCDRVIYHNEKFYNVNPDTRFLKSSINEKLYIKAIELRKVNVGLYSELVKGKTEHIKAMPLFKLYDTKQKIVKQIKQRVSENVKFNI